MGKGVIMKEGWLDNGQLSVSVCKGKFACVLVEGSCSSRPRPRAQGSWGIDLERVTPPRPSRLHS